MNDGCIKVSGTSCLGLYDRLILYMKIVLLKAYLSDGLIVYSRVFLLYILRISRLTPILDGI